MVDPLRGITATRRDLIAAASTALLGPARFASLGGTRPTEPPPSGREFFVSAQGDDGDDGLSASTPWRSTEKINAFRFSPGDRIRLRCGDTFHGPVKIQGSGRAPLSPLSLESYGGDLHDLPKLSCYKIIMPDAWIHIGGGVWRADINNLAHIGGNRSTRGSAGANIGFLNIDGEMKTNRKPNSAALRDDWDFYSDGVTYLYVKSARNPADRAASIMAAPGVVALGDTPAIRYRHLEIVGAGAHGVRWANRSNIDMRFCHLHQIGGAYLSGHLRYGNGVEAWVGCSDINVSDCLFGDIYDAATTAQGYPVNQPGAGWNRISFNDNFAYRCSQAFEIWARYGARPGEGACPPGSGFHDVTALRWRLFDIGRGPFGDLRTSRHEVAPFLIYRTETPENDIRVSVSQMKNCGDRLIASPGVDRLPAQYRLEQSNLTLRGDQLLMGNRGQTARQARDWLKANGFNTTTVVIDDAPRSSDPEAIKTQWIAHLSTAS